MHHDDAKKVKEHHCTMTILSRISQIEEQLPCNLRATFVKNTDELVDLVKSNKVDIAFPIFSEATKEALEHKWAFASQGCSLIVNTKRCETE